MHRLQKITMMPRRLNEDLKQDDNLTTILSISYDPPLLHTREWILKAEGYRVTSACGFVDALEQCRTHKFGLAIMGHSIPQDDKVALISEFKKQSDAPILSIVRHGDTPLAQADYWVDASDGPQALVRAVKAAVCSRSRAAEGGQRARTKISV